MNCIGILMFLSSNPVILDENESELFIFLSDQILYNILSCDLY